MIFLNFHELLFLQKNLYQQEVKQNRLIMLLLLLIVALASFMAYRGMSGRKRFKKIAEFDQLTGISNRYHFNNLAKVALDYCELNTKPAALILFDLDYFKTINDNYGHASGDWALQQVVKTCRNFMRNNDVFGRIGGEEFALVVEQVTPAQLTAIATQLCYLVEQLNIPHQVSPLAVVTISIGSVFLPLDKISGFKMADVLRRADVCLYRAKDKGRNRVEVEVI